MNAPPVICVFGLSGIGKTTLIKKALEAVPGTLHLEASALIKQGLADAEMESEWLRRAGGERVLANQQILVEIFQREIGIRPGSVVAFDGHLVIDAEDRLVEIPRDVIAALGPQVLVHVEEIPEAIRWRRLADPSRRRPERSAEVLGGHQATSRRLCSEYSRVLGVEMHTLRPSSVKDLAKIMKQASSSQGNPPRR